MSRDNFMNELEKVLQATPCAKREEAFNYYVEYFEDRGIKAMDPVPADVASPKVIAQEILSNIPYSQTQVNLGSFRVNEQRSSQSNTSPKLSPLSQLFFKLNMGSIKLNFQDSK